MVEMKPGVFVWMQSGSRTLQDTAENDKTQPGHFFLKKCEEWTQLFPPTVPSLFPGIIAQEAVLLQNEGANGSGAVVTVKPAS